MKRLEKKMENCNRSDLSVWRKTVFEKKAELSTQRPVWVVKCFFLIFVTRYFRELFLRRRTLSGCFSDNIDGSFFFSWKTIFYAKTPREKS